MTDPRGPRRPLDLLVDNDGSWLLHYPVYINSYCLAYDLARSIFSKTQSAGRIRECLKYHDWSKGLPKFIERDRHEIFIATKLQIDKLRREVTRKLVERPFTRYKVVYLFAHKEKFRKRGVPVEKLESVKTFNGLVSLIAEINLDLLYLITDIRPTAELLQKQLLEQLRSLRSRFRTNIRIREFFDREEADLYDDTPKIYLFSAPVTHIMAQRSKYVRVSIDDVQPVNTYIGVRYPPYVDGTEANNLLTAVCNYYSEIFAVVGSTEQSIPIPLSDWSGISERYAQMAESAGQPNPFPALRVPDAPKDDAVHEADLHYLKILSLHHAPPEGA